MGCSWFTGTRKIVTVMELRGTISGNRTPYPADREFKSCKEQHGGRECGVGESLDQHRRGRHVAKPTPAA